MNFITIIQLPILISVAIFGRARGFYEDDYIPCDTNPPATQTSVPITVYINGDTKYDHIFFGRYCSWKAGGFDFDTLAPITVKVGARVYCDENQCICPNADDSSANCLATFQNVCAQIILGDTEYLELLCCSQKLDDTTPEGYKGFYPCVSEISGLQEQIDNCVANDNPQQIALANSEEVIIEKGVGDYGNEPYMLINGVYDRCIDDQFYYWFLQTICSILSPDIATCNEQCIEAMGWSSD